MLAGLAVEDRICSGCATDLHLSTNPELARQGVDVNDEIVCHVCAAKEEYLAELRESHKDDEGFFYGRAIVAQLVSTEVPTPTDDSEAVN